MLERILLTLIAQVVPWILAKALEKSQKSKQTVETENDIDQKLEKFKNAYRESFNGEAITSEQRKNLKQSIRNFLKSETGGL